MTSVIFITTRRTTDEVRQNVFYIQEVGEKTSNMIRTIKKFNKQGRPEVPFSDIREIHCKDLKRKIMLLIKDSDVKLLMDDVLWMTIEHAAYGVRDKFRGSLTIDILDNLDSQFLSSFIPMALDMRRVYGVYPLTTLESILDDSVISGLFFDLTHCLECDSCCCGPI